jgi:hypothetical protein
MEVIMHVVDWDSYIVCRRDLVQHLIGHVDIDADLPPPELPWLVITGAGAWLPNSDSSSKWNESHDRT